MRWNPPVRTEYALACETPREGTDADWVRRVLAKSERDREAIRAGIVGSVRLPLEKLVAERGREIRLFPVWLWDDIWS